MSLETTDRLVSHIVSAQLTDLATEDIEKAKVFLLDTMGVGVAGSSGASVDKLLATVQAWGAGDEATVWVTGQRVSAQAAAIVNAYQIHCLEYDCVHEGAVVHPMATVLSSMLAYAERRSWQGRPVNGREFLMAMVLGVDVAAYMGMAATGPVRFFRPATAGGLGATAAIARLEGLSAEGIKDALGNMYGQTSGTLQPHAEGSPLLGLQIGFNARGALAALDLAKAGFQGPHDIVDGQYGYLTMFEADDFDLDIIWRELGQIWQMSRLSHKPFPSGRLTHGVVDALNRIMTEFGITPDDIVGITGYVPPLVYRLVGRPDVLDPEPNYAKLCLRYVAGAFMARGKVDVPEFRGPDVLSDPEIHHHAAKVDLIQDDNPDENALDPQRFEFRLKDGRVETIELLNVFGHPQSALTAAQNRDKFDRCVSYGLRPMPAGQAQRLADMVTNLEDLIDVADLARATVI
jgi:aconitate decarboxylase